MGQKMNNAPVYFTVAQVRFNPILNLEAYLPAIQDKMREADFPDYKREAYQQLILPFQAGDPGQIPTPSFQQQARCIFGDMAGTSSFVLEHSAMALQTTDYETFESFSETFLNGLSIVHKALELDFMERVGLRYLDAVIPNDGESLVDYLIPQVLGLSQILSGPIHTISETLVKQSEVQLVSRVVIKEGQVNLPPELMSLSPLLNSQFTQANGPHAIIDSDASQSKRQPFDIESLKNILTNQHDVIHESFTATVTKHALKTWMG